MYKDPVSLRPKVVNHYLHKSKSLKQTARRFGLHYQTVYKWVKRYRNEGMASLMSTYHSPWNRLDRRLEESIVLLKEKYPGITLKTARQMLAQEKIKISLKGIISVWKRYGYAGYQKDKYTNEFIEYVPWSKEAKGKFEQAKTLFDLGDIKKSAEILNTIPVLPKNDLIIRLPDSMLNLRRRIEKIYALFGRMPLPDYLRLSRELYDECKKKHLFYSALRVGIVEVVTLGWSGRVDEQLEKVAQLKRIFHICPSIQTGKRTGLLFEPYFTLLIGEAMTYAHNLEVNKGNKIANQCARLLKSHKNISPGFMTDLGTLYSNLEEYAKAEHWFNQAIHKLPCDKGKKLKLYLAYQIGFAECDVHKGHALLKESTAIEWVHDLWKLRLRSLFSLVQGKPSRSIDIATKCINISKKSELHRDIFNTFFTIASAYSSLGEERKAKRMLIHLIPHLRKNKLRKQASMIKLLLKDDFQINTEMRLLPTLKLLHFLKQRRYRKSLHYAKKRNILGYFYRFLFFFPEVVHKAIENGKSLGLPRSILKLPVFNKNFFVYNIKLLGNLVVYKNQKYLKLRTPPKNASFIIYLATKAGEPGKKIFLNNLYNNFWPGKANPSSNLSHLLVRIKKALRLPSHLLEISHRGGRSVLINRGIHFITDCSEFEQILATAHAFERAEEWAFARKEYLHTFRLFRGAPFEKMYDPWSEQMRRVMLNRLENEGIHFAQECIKQKNKQDAKKILEKISKIIPNSTKLVEILETCEV